jgi:ABC-2 type transport system ATP-binding protein
MIHVIDFDGLTVSYGAKKALDGLTLRVAKGEIFGFLGPNGAGKSTAIKALLGLVVPTGGRVTLHGLPPSDPRSRARAGFLPEEARYYRFLTPVEALRFYGELCRVPKKTLEPRIKTLLERVGLTDDRNRPLGTFSKGMTQKLGLAQALIDDPDTLILDEPTSGLDPIARMDLRTLLFELKREGKTIFFSSHELSEVELMCDSVAVLKEGRVLKAGPMTEFVGSDHERNLERFFLGAMGVRA